MVSNHDIRFNCTREDKELADKFHCFISPELKKSAFYKKVFFFGLLELKKMAMRENNKVATKELLQL